MRGEATALKTLSRPRLLFLVIEINKFHSVKISYRCLSVTYCVSAPLDKNYASCPPSSSRKMSPLYLTNTYYRRFRVCTCVNCYVPSTLPDGEDTSSDPACNRVMGMRYGNSVSPTPFASERIPCIGDRARPTHRYGCARFDGLSHSVYVDGRLERRCDGIVLDVRTTRPMP